MKNDQEFVRLNRWAGKKKHSVSMLKIIGYYQELYGWYFGLIGGEERREEGIGRFSSKFGF